MLLSLDTMVKFFLSLLRALIGLERSDMLNILPGQEFPVLVKMKYLASPPYPALLGSKYTVLGNHKVRLVLLDPSRVPGIDRGHTP